MKDFKYEVLYITKHSEIIAGFNNMYIAIQFYENFVEKAYADNWDKKWLIQLIETETNKVISEERN